MMKFIHLLLFGSLTFTGLSQNHTPVEVATVPVYSPKEKIIYYQLGEKSIPLKMQQYGERKDIVFINLHDDESTAVEAAKLILEKHGGLLIEVENNSQRNIRFRIGRYFYAVDPNRIFSRKGIIKSIEELGRISPKAISMIEKFGNRILDLIPKDVQCVIALHNNSPDFFSALSYTPGNRLAKEAKKVYINPNEDPDDFFLTTNWELYESLSKSGYNTVLQDNIDCTDDGSLSVYYGKRNQQYVNCETEHGKKDQYYKMIQSLLNSLESMTR